MQVKIIISSCKRKMQLLFLCENWIPFFPDIEMRKNWKSNIMNSQLRIKHQIKRRETNICQRVLKNAQ